MPTYAIFLRAINVGGNRLLPMAELRARLTELGYQNVRTILQSGNLLIDMAKSEEDLRQLRADLDRIAGFKLDIAVRTIEELEALVELNPFTKAAKEAPSWLTVLFLGRPPTVSERDRLRDSVVGREEIGGDGQDLYLFYPDGIGNSKLTPQVIKRCLGQDGTARNWNTIQKMIAPSKCP